MNLPLKKRPLRYSTSSESSSDESVFKSDSFKNHLRKFKAQLRRHKSKSSGRYSCNLCDKKFVQRSSLTTHFRIHSGERPYKCADCPGSFSDFSTFTKHKRTHTGDKPYGCPVCGRKFSQSGNMHRHWKSVHRSESERYEIRSSELRVPGSDRSPEQTFFLEQAFFFDQRFFSERSTMKQFL